MSSKNNTKKTIKIKIKKKKKKKQKKPPDLLSIAKQNKQQNNQKRKKKRNRFKNAGNRVRDKQNKKGDSIANAAVELARTKAGRTLEATKAMGKLAKQQSKRAARAAARAAKQATKKGFAKAKNIFSNLRKRTTPEYKIKKGSCYKQAVELSKIDTNSLVTLDPDALQAMTDAYDDNKCNPSREKVTKKYADKIRKKARTRTGGTTGASKLKF